LDQFRRGSEGVAGRQHLVDDQHVLPGPWRPSVAAGVAEGWPTEKVKAPETGWVSVEITRQATV
jgi:hypothetical protein